MAALPHRRTRGRSSAATDWEHYRDVNERFADAVCDEVDCRRSDRARAGLSLRAGAAADPRAAAARDHHHVLAHPVAERRALRHLPVARASCSRGCSAASILGFHTQLHCNNFLDARRPLPRGAHRSRAATRSSTAGARTLVRPYPISIEWPNRWALPTPPADRVPARRVRASSACPTTRCSAWASTGSTTPRAIEERLLAVERLLERFPQFRGRFTFVQLGRAEPHA